MRKRILDEKGFTLIEMVVTLILVGIIAVLAGMGIVSIVEGFVFTRMNAATAQKAQLAITRLKKEFYCIRSVTATVASPTSITFTSSNCKQEVPPENRVVSLDGSGSNLKLKLDGDILTDDVSKFTLTYYDSYNDTTPSTSWSASSKVIEITLGLTGANGVVSEFTTRRARRREGY